MIIIQKEFIKSGLQYRQLIEESIEGVWVVDSGEFTTLVNSSMAKMLGYEVEEIIGHSVFEFMDVNAKGTTKLHLKKRKKGISEVREAELLHKNGNIINVRMKASPLLDDKGKYIGTMAFITDISKEKQAEDLLREKQAALESIFKVAPTGIGFVENRVIKQVNDYFCSLIGYTRDELIGINARLVYPSDEEFAYVGREKYKQINKFGISTVETRFKCKDGKILNILLSSAPIDINDPAKGVTFTALDITERKKAEKELKESEEKLKYLVSSSPAIIYTSKPFGDFGATYISENVKDKMGYSPEDFLENSEFWIKNIHPDDIERVLLELKKLNKKSHSVYEYRIKFKDGNYYWMRDEVKLIKDEKGIPIATIGSIVEITKAKEAEKKLKESEAKNRNLITNLMDIIIELDIKGNFLYVSPQIYDIMGYRQDEVIGTNGFDYIHPADIKEAINILKTAMKLRKRVYIEYRALHKKGYYNYVSATGRIVDNEGVIKVVAVVRDISERRKAKKLLSESEKKYRELYEDAPNGYFSVSPNRLILGCNISAEKLLGYSKEEFLKMNVFNLYAVDEDGIEKAKKVFQQCLQGIPIQDEELKMKKKNGETIWVSLSVKPVLDKSGKVIESRSMMIDINNRKNTEQKLIESEEKYRTVVEKSLQGICILQDVKIVFANNALVEILGYSVKELYSSSIEEVVNLIYIDDRDFVFKRHRERLNGKKVPSHYTFRVIRKDNQIRWVDMYASLLEYGGKPAVQEVFIDITDKKNAEQKLKESEEKYREMAELLPVIIYETDINLNLTYANPAAFDKFKYTHEDFQKGVNIRSFISPQDLPKSIERIKIIMRGEMTEPAEYLLKRKDGSTFYARVHSRPIIQNDKVIGLRGAITDIDNIIRAEKKLKESEIKYRDLIESSSMGLLEIDVINNKIAYINPKLLEIIGYSRDELKDENIFPKIIHPEDFKEIFQNREEQDLVFRIITKDRKVKWLSGNRLHHYDGKGELANLRLWLRDITKEKELEEIKSNLITRFSHEFKTPLISIKGFTQFLLTEYRQNLDDEMISFLSKIMDGSEKLKTLVDSFIESSQLNEDVVKIIIKQENLSDLIKMGLEEMEGMIKIRNHKINLNIKENLIVNFDRDKIYIVFTNLLLNSIKYTPKGGKISIQSHKTDDFITITLKDNGVGLTEEEKLKLFKPFGKIERYGQGWDVITDGMGMGLYISKEIIDLHGGKIWVESEGRNRGCIFNFSLPVKKFS